MKYLILIFISYLVCFGADLPAPPKIVKTKQQVVTKGAFKPFVNFSNPKGMPRSIVWTNISFTVPFDCELWISYQTSVWKENSGIWWKAGDLGVGQISTIAIDKEEPMMFFKLIEHKPWPFDY